MSGHPRAVLQREVTDFAMFIFAWTAWYPRADDIVAPLSGVQEDLARQAIRSAVLSERRSEFQSELAQVGKCLAIRFPGIDPKLFGYAIDELDSLIHEELEP